MLPTAEKNRKLIRQYPFVATVLETVPMNTTHELSIKVEVADGDLMFRRPDNVGIDRLNAFDDSFLFELTGPRKGWIGRKTENMFIVRKSGDVTRFNWNNPSDARDDRPRHPHEAFWGTNSQGMYTEPLWDDIKYVVWLTLTAWYTDTHSNESIQSRFGDFRHRSAEVTIYREPKQGFEKLILESSALEHLRLNNRVFTENVSQPVRVITAIGGRVEELCTLFVEDVWQASLLDIFTSCDQRGMSGKFGTTSLRLYEIAGRNMVTLEDEVSDITFIGESSGSHLGLSVYSLNGTLPQLRQLVKRTIKQWQTNPEWRSEIRPNENVSIL